MRTFKSFVFFSVLAYAASAQAQGEAPAVEEQETQVDLEEEAGAQPEPAPAPAAPPPAAPPPAAAASVGATATAEPAAVAVDNTAAQPVTSRPSPVSRGGEDDSGKEWTFDYHGYLRAPFRLGIGSRTNRYCLNPDGETTRPCEADETPTAGDQSSTTFHRPLVPDDQYLNWQYTGHQKGDWAEMFFSVGNDVVSGTVAVQGFQYTDASWKNDTAQFGIGQGWVEFNSDLGFENIKFNAKVGSFWARYGMAGKYDAGYYDTYLFGRTHTMGAVSRVDIGLDEEYTLGIDGGVGHRRPDPSIYNRARYTLLAHAHVFLNWVDEVEFSLNYLHSFSQSETPIMQEGATLSNPTGMRPNGATTLLFAENTVDDTTPDGSLSVWGADARLDLDTLGYFYAGFSQIRAKTAFTVAPAIEVMHSFGGGEFTGGVIDNYLESPFCNTTYGDVAPGQPQNLSNTCSNGTGTVNNILAQYELSLANFGLFEGGTDLRMRLFGTMSFISVDDAAAFENDPLADDHRQDGTRKLKFGGDFEYYFLPWMSAGLRADRVQPHSKIPEQSFTVVSPRLSFRSNFATREEVSLIYTRYFYEQRECAVGNPAEDPFHTNAPPVSRYNDADNGLPGRVFCVQPPTNPSLPDGFGAHGNNQDADVRGAPSSRPDLNTISIQATMWW